MGFFVRAAAWSLGLVASAVSAIVVYQAFLAPGPPAPQKLAGPICPAPISMPAPAPGAPVDDVAGVRPGFTAADAKAVLLCRDPTYHIEFEQIWHTPTPANLASRQRMFAISRRERIALGLVGQPEHEVVAAIFQDIQYGETTLTEPPDAMEGALRRHYGAPQDRHADASEINLWWLYRPDGKPITPLAPKGADPLTAFTTWVSGSWDSGNCERQISLSPIAPARWNDQCGLTIHARIEIRKEDSTRVARYRIVSLDQAKLAAAVGNYREQIGVKTP